MSPCDLLVLKQREIICKQKTEYMFGYGGFRASRCLNEQTAF